MTHSNPPAFDRLLDGYLHQTLSDEEITVFFELLQQPENQLRLQEVLDDDLQKARFTGLAGNAQMEAAFQQLSSKIKPAAPVRRLYLRWVAAAAVLLLVAGYWLLSDRWGSKSTTVPQQVKIDVAPGRDKAILTLADGRQVLLDSAGNGLIAQQGATGIRKIDGQIVYDASGSRLPATDSRLIYNTMSTPRGGQYQLTLPDGSKVWLNAASSITYPTAFTGSERRVSITGEVYFEISPLPASPGGGGVKGNSRTSHGKIPFVVVVDGKQEVEVLGTHFNVNSYGDDETIRTTLLEGKVKVSTKYEVRNTTETSVILKPGEQAQSSEIRVPIRVIRDLDLDKIMAWKNGFFNFEGMPLKEVMKQLERWYDITVVYEQGVPEISFFGEISRNLSLADLTNALKDVGVHFRIEAGRKLVVLP